MSAVEACDTPKEVSASIRASTQRSARSSRSLWSWLFEDNSVDFTIVSAYRPALSTHEIPASSPGLSDPNKTLGRR